STTLHTLYVLDVPSDKSVRTEIRAGAEAYIRGHRLLPPASYEVLYQVAGTLIETHHWEERYRAFVMVCCGNEVWRPVIGVIPFSRRIFLLPQCLRSTAHCKAPSDEMGLLCGECGNCSISGFLREVENLGYVALVTEGTTITTRLIESGKVDAVIGVGCMEVLQKMFASVNKYAIPAIGIPLITCGCSNTTPDIDWIKKEIYNYREDSSFRLLNLNYLKNKSSSVFGAEQLTRFLGPAQNQTANIAFEALLSGGNRLRPFLAVLAYEAFVAEPDPAIVNMLAVSVECFHKASLVHDDIEDNDLTRYGKDTIHARHGIPLALNTGDYLLGEGYRIISESALPPEIIVEAVRIIARGHRSLSIGQGAELASIRSQEILSHEAMLGLFDNKTAAAFRVSLLLGAVVGGASATDLKVLEQFSRAIGIAYQLKDDLEDYSGEKGDIEVRKFSIILSLLAGHLTSAEKQLLLSAQSPEDFSVIYGLIDAYNIPQQAREILLGYISEAETCLAELTNLGLKLALHEILGKIFK
ncbi:MAG TPA: polyprenyl synthetase family protein, partial [Bacteroidales bacterium]|nr:polyprenyl synthetase family protein [Bacteroidales bacterium]